MASRELTSATELAKKNRSRFPNESEEYRRARNALLAEEIELRRRLERVAEMRRQLPAGGQITTDYRFEGENGPVTLSGLFGDKDTLLVYSYMFGPQRERPCPSCTSFMATWEHKITDLEQNVALAMVARSSIDRLRAAKQARGWTKLKVYSDTEGNYTRDYVSPEDADMPGFSVFTRKDGIIRHFWSGEMGPDMADPGQDPRGAPDLDPLWSMLDFTPAGRAAKWYPKLEYSR